MSARKAQVLATSQGPMQNNNVPREASPSPSFRERQRAMKAHSMPIVPSLGQVLAGNGQQNHTQASPNGSNGPLPARRSPPATSRISPVTGKLQPSPHMQRGDHTPDRVGSPPPMPHSQSTSALPQLTSSGSPPAHQPRPMPRSSPPQFLDQYQNMEERWEVTPELLREIEAADQQGQLQGTSGICYAGGAASSSNLSIHHSAKDPAVERVRAAGRSSPKDSDSQSSGKRQTRDKDRDGQNARESPKVRERSQTVSSTMSQHTDSQSLAQRTPEYRGSPPFHTPMASPGERSAGYTQYMPDSYTSPAAVPQSQISRKPVPAAQADTSTMRSTPPSAKLASQNPPQQPVNPRVADRALPLQEEPEEDLGPDYTENEAEYDNRRSPHGEQYPDGKRYGGHGGVMPHTDEDDEETLNEEAHEHLQGKSESDDSGFTPRSPSTNLPERPRDERYSPNSQYTSSSVAYSPMDNQKTVRVKHRSGPTDQLGMRSLDPTLFEQTMNTPRNGQEVTSNGQRALSHSPPQSNAQPIQYSQTYQAPPSRHFAATNLATNRLYEPQHSQSLPPMSPHMEDLQGVFDNPTSHYLQSFLQSPVPALAGVAGRPNAPIPPTPLTHTAAPSPSPLSALPSDVEPRQIGSPYPYPFTHIRRTALSAAQDAPSSTYDPNHPAAVREQLAMQMHIYALNNGLAAPSESAFSPSSTPFPGTGYNPWAFLHQPGRPADSRMSMRSSPSHEPVNLPMPPLRPRGVRRTENGLLRTVTGRRRVKPPPRVESTQPRETSPEPSSGEETAGEDRFVDQYSTNGHDSSWTNGINGHSAENGDVKDQAVEEEEDDWIDEDDDEEDLLQFEYHPSFVSKPVKRRRRWEMRWDSLVQSFQALDRETDATLVVLAAPSHGDELYALTSRNIRRDPTLSRSKALSDIRSNFGALAHQRRVTRTPNLSIIDTLVSSTSGSVDGSQASSETREEDLKRALEAAMGSLGAMGAIYEQREARWRDEMRKLSEDRAHIEMLLRQTLGTPLPNGQSADHTSLLG